MEPGPKSGTLCDHASGILGCGYPGLEIKNVQSVEEIVKREVKDGSIILMHDSFPTSVEAALEIADMLTEAGYDLVTVDQLLVT